MDERCDQRPGMGNQDKPEGARRKIGGLSGQFLAQRFLVPLREPDVGFVEHQDVGVCSVPGVADPGERCSNRDIFGGRGLIPHFPSKALISLS